MKLNFKTFLYGIGLVSALALASPGAMAADFPDFQVDPTYDGDSSDAFTADKIVGNYVEAITFVSNTATTGSFSVRLRWVPSAFVTDNGTENVAAGTSGLTVDYQLYALYEAQGTYSTNALGATTFVTEAGLGSFSLLLTEDTGSLFANGSGAISFANIFDLNAGVDPGSAIATGTPLAGSGTLDPFLPTCNVDGQINCGSFGTSTSFALTSLGNDFFIDPVPFYNISFQSGQLNNFDVGGAEQEINGSLDAVFAPVPEPGTMVLFGSALVGLGVALRRRRMS